MLRRLESMGTQVLSCKTCIDFFELESKLGVGEITTSKVVVDEMVKAGKSIIM